MLRLNYLILGLSLINLCQAQPIKLEQPQTTKEVTIRVLNKITGQTTTLKTTLLKPINSRR